jgi:hypothetical protein
LKVKNIEDKGGDDGVFDGDGRSEVFVEAGAGHPTLEVFWEVYPVGLRPGRFCWPIAQLFDRDGQED